MLFKMIYLYLLDTSAVLAFGNAEAGAQSVMAVIRGGKSAICFVSRTEIYYHYKPHLRTIGAQRYRQFLALPLRVVWPSPSLCEYAGRLKTDYLLGLGDAYVAASAIVEDFILLHRDKDFLPVKELKQEYLK